MSLLERIYASSPMAKSMVRLPCGEETQVVDHQILKLMLSFGDSGLAVALRAAQAMGPYTHEHVERSMSVPAPHNLFSLNRAALQVAITKYAAGLMRKFQTSRQRRL